MVIFGDPGPVIRRTQALKDYLRLNLSPIAISARIAITAIIASRGALDDDGAVRTVSVSLLSIGRWWNRRGDEMDLVAVNGGAREILFGEVKWTNKTAGRGILGSGRNIIL